MDSKEFFFLVAEMREAQQKYFRTGSKAALTRRRDLECKVDAEISRVKTIPAYMAKMS